MHETMPWRVLEEPPTASEPGVLAERTRRPSWRVTAGVTAAVALAAAAFVVAGSAGPGQIHVAGAAAVAASSARPGADGNVDGGPSLVVDVQGAVARPGVVRLPAGARVADAIAAAGGYGPRVDAGRVGSAINLAAVLTDGQQVVVPSRDDPAPAAAGGSATGGAKSGATRTGPLDLNRATATDLDGLPGIGPVTPAKIIAARAERPFARVEDLRTRKIVGASTFDKIKALVTVS
jgi:competence protein ComEA